MDVRQGGATVCHPAANHSATTRPVNRECGCIRGSQAYATEHKKRRPRMTPSSLETVLCGSIGPYRPFRALFARHRRRLRFDVFISDYSAGLTGGAPLRPPTSC